MKKVIFLFAFAVGTNSFAQTISNKICFGSTKDQATKGVVMQALINNQTITLKTIKIQSTVNSLNYNGTFLTYNSPVKGRDGKIYLSFKGLFNEYQDVILADSELLKRGTTGLLQIRARGEGFFNSVFMCKDAQ